MDEEEVKKPQGHVVGMALDTMSVEEREHFVRVPARIAELDRMAPPFRKRPEKDFQSLDVHRPARRKLIEDRPKSVAEVFRAGEESLDWLLGVLQLFHVREKAAGLDRVQEAARHAAFPRGEGRRFRESIK